MLPHAHQPSAETLCWPWLDATTYAGDAGVGSLDDLHILRKLDYQEKDSARGAHTT